MRIRPVLRFMIWSKLQFGIILEALRNIPYWKEAVKPYTEYSMIYHELFSKKSKDFRMAEVKFISDDKQLKVYETFRVKEKITEIAFQYRIQKEEIRAVYNNTDTVLYTLLTFRFRDFKIICQVLNKNDIIIQDIEFNKGVSDVSYMCNMRWIYQMIRVMADEIYKSNTIVAMDSSSDVYLGFTEKFIKKYNECVAHLKQERSDIVQIMLREFAYRAYASGVDDVSVMYAKLNICIIKSTLESEFDIRWNAQIKLK